jgi:hypothetical protein
VQSNAETAGEKREKQQEKKRRKTKNGARFSDLGFHCLFLVFALWLVVTDV